jgi:transcription elongation GreA/GreB family factor
VARVVYHADADAGQGLISVFQPLGWASLGASVGQVTDCGLAGGPRGLRVDKIIFQAQQSLRTQRLSL